MTQKVVIARDERFSPNSVERDRAIAKAVAWRLQAPVVNENEALGLTSECALVLTMGRSKPLLSHLKRLEDSGVVVLNPASGIERCRRSTLMSMMAENGIPQPSTEGADGYWLKSDGDAQNSNDVVFCADAVQLHEGICDMERRGVTQYVVQAHVDGDLVKFYGVDGTGFFHTCYPTDDGISKFGDERRNGPAHHYDYSRDLLQECAEKISKLTRVPIYGGDAIVRADGSFVIIDFNDWPSFSRCCNEAADAIVKLTEQILR